ncbi:MAG: hypothetical protein LBQ31_08065 [Bacteroidales bacterium]|nr:hypothetical protein [Bacteroidales bacterium]
MSARKSEALLRNPPVSSIPTAAIEPTADKRISAQSLTQPTPRSIFGNSPIILRSPHFRRPPYHYEKSTNNNRFRQTARSSFEAVLKSFNFKQQDGRFIKHT